jgi:hypothetical protein
MNLGVLMVLYIFISALLMKNICKNKVVVDEDGNLTRYGWETTS